MVRFDDIRRGEPAACFPLGKVSELVIMRITDHRFKVMTKGGRKDVPETIPEGGFSSEVTRDQIGPIILALMQVQKMMVEGDE